MNSDKIAKIIADLAYDDPMPPSPGAHAWYLDRDNLIDALADYFTQERWELVVRLRNEHSMEAAVAIGLFDHAKFTRSAKGEHQS